MAEEPAPSKKNGEALNRVAFDYLKGQFFRVIHVDGAIGSLTPNGHIHMGLFSERPAIPRRQVHQLGAAGALGPILPNETISRDSVVREIEVDAMLTVQAAEVLRDWLADRIREAKQRTPPEEEKGKS